MENCNCKFCGQEVPEERIHSIGDNICINCQTNNELRENDRLQKKRENGEQIVLLPSIAAYQLITGNQAF